MNGFMHMRNLKHILSVVLMCLFAYMATAQELEEYPSARNAIESFFSELDLTKVPNGLLQDYSTELASLEQFNGVLTDSVTVERLLHTDPTSILMSHVIIKDGVIVLDLSEEDALSLGISSELYSTFSSKICPQNEE